MTDTFIIQFEHLNIEVVFRPNYFKMLDGFVSHLTLRTVYPEKHDLPGANYDAHILTDRSFVSLWPNMADIEACGGAKSYAMAYLEAYSHTSQWQALRQQAVQGSLF